MIEISKYNSALKEMSIVTYWFQNQINITILQMLMNHNFHSKKFKIEFGSGASTRFCKKKFLKSVLALIGLKNVVFVESHS